MLKPHFAVGFIYFFQAVTSHAGEPCEPSKCQTCGRLVISIVGAGDMADDPSHPIDRPVYNNKHSGEASRHLLQFTAGKEATLPSKHIVITSDPYLKHWLEGLPFSRKVSLAGVVDNSIPAFDRMIDPSSKDSPLNRALSAFKNNRGCGKLMGASQNVLPFLNIDILVDGELAESNESSSKNRIYGISTFRNEGTVGTYEKWMREGNIVGKDELSKLMGRLSGSLTHVFVKTCKAGLIGNLFDSAMNDAGTCGCYLGVADETQIHYSGGSGVLPPFNYAMPKQGHELRKIPLRDSFGKWTQTDTSMIKMAAALLDQHKILIMNPLDPKSKETALFSALQLHRNPLFGFGYTSADALTNQALALLEQNPSTSKLAKQIADSEFIFEMQQITIKAYQSGASAEVDANLKRIRSLVTEARNQLGPLIDNNSKGKLDPTIFDRETEDFYSCLKNPNPENDFCATIKNDIEQINNKTASHSTLSADEEVFRDKYGWFLQTLKDLKFRDLWKQYLNGEIPLADFMLKMSSARLAFVEFKRGVAHLYQEKSDRQNSEDEEVFQKKRRAFEYLTSALDRAFDSSQSQMFDYLKKEAVTTKLARTEAAMDLLAENLKSMEPPGVGEKLITEMANKLECLVRYPVGPAHDRNKPGLALTISQERGNAAQP